MPSAAGAATMFSMPTAARLVTRSAEADAIRRLVLVPSSPRKPADGGLRSYRLARARVEGKAVPAPLLGSRST